MITLRFGQLAEITGGQLGVPALRERAFTGISTDSRTVEAGQLFFAIKGDRHDGHDHLAEVVARRAAGAVVGGRFAPQDDLPPTFSLVQVEDTHDAMLRLARWYLDQTPARRVGITGSNGKTTTKEYAFRLLSAVESRAYRSPGNFNNLFGAPLAVFAMPLDTRVTILEMGISVPGEMARLASVVRPDVVAITNVSATHLEQLGSVEAVAREKLSMLRHAAPDAPLVVNADDELLLREAVATGRTIVTFAVRSEAHFHPQSLTTDPDGSVTVAIDGDRFRLTLFGAYQVYNLLAAYAIARTLGYRFKEVDTMSLRLGTSALRGEILAMRGITFISDCYNANPEAVTAGLESFAAYPGGSRRIIILGDMLELGKDESRFHGEIGRSLAETACDFAVLVGPRSADTLDAAREAGMPAGKLSHFADAGACADAMTAFLRPGDLVYLKASRGIGLEAVLNKFRRAEGDA